MLRVCRVAIGAQIAPKTLPARPTQGKTHLRTRRLVVQAPEGRAKPSHLPRPIFFRSFFDVLPVLYLLWVPVMSEVPLDDRVSVALERNPYVSRRNLRFEARDGRVVIKGVVNSYFQKQMAQEALRKVEGVREIANELEVCWT